MSKQQAKAFIKELHNDDALKSELESSLDFKDQATIESKENADEVIDQIVGFAAGYGRDFSVDEYKSVISELKKGGELSDDQLDEISGGQFTRTWLP